MKITKKQLKQIIKEELEAAMAENKNDPAYKRGRADGEAGKDKQAGIKAEKGREGGSVERYKAGYLSGEELRTTGGA